MKRFYNLPRAAGKTTRLLYLSEHYQTPILCTHDKKHILIEKANQFGIDIPTPIDVNDIKNTPFIFTKLKDEKYYNIEFLKMKRKRIKNISFSKSYRC